VVFIPIYRRKGMYLELHHHLRKVFHDLVRQWESRIEEGHLCVDHEHMLISMPPKYTVSAVVEFIKGKSAISMARPYGGKRKKFVGQHFWERGYYMSTVGRHDTIVRKYLQEQEIEDHRVKQLWITDEW
jgi:putative transposase